jgi:hypothetical protein
MDSRGTTDPGVVRRVLVSLTLLLLASSVPVARGQQSALSVPDVEVVAGTSHLVLPIGLDTDIDLTGLHFELSFDTSFCDALKNPDGITVSAVGRSSVEPAAMDVMCEVGRIIVDMRDETGEVVIPAGEGPIVEFDLGALRKTASGSFILTPTNVVTQPALSLSVDAGILSITALATTTTSSSTTLPPTTVTTSTTHPSATTTSTVVPQPGPSTTTTTVPTGPCPLVFTLAAVGCRLAALTTVVQREVDSGRLSPRFLIPLARARDAHSRAVGRCAAGDRSRARIQLRSVRRTLIGFRHRLGTLTARRRILAEVRQPLRTTAADLLLDLRGLVRVLACPGS